MGFVQAKAGFGSGVSSIVVTFNSAVVAGNRMIAGVGSGDNFGETFSSISDGGSNSWHNDLPDAGTGPCKSDVLSAPIVGGGGTAIAVTITIGGSDDFPAVIFEASGVTTVSGAGAVRTSKYAFSNSGSATASATTTGSSTAGDYVFGFAHSDGKMSGTWSGASSCTLRASDNTHTYTFAAVDKAATGVAETAAAGETVTNVGWTFSTVVYVQSAAVGGTAPQVTYAFSSN
jgi:sarcosine oxidase delta subunit